MTSKNTFSKSFARRRQFSVLWSASGRMMPALWWDLVRPAQLLQWRAQAARTGLGPPCTPCCTTRAAVPRPIPSGSGEPPPSFVGSLMEAKIVQGHENFAPGTLGTVALAKPSVTSRKQGGTSRTQPPTHMCAQCAVCSLPGFPAVGTRPSWGGVPNAWPPVCRSSSPRLGWRRPGWEPRSSPALLSMIYPQY